MINIAIFGHSPDAFSDLNSISYAIDDSIAIIKYQHEKERDLTFLLNCNPGVNQLACDIIMKQDLSYEIFLSAPPQEASQHWSEFQQEQLKWQIGKARALHICDAENTYESRKKRDEQIIDKCQWILVFWNGKHQGETYNAIKYAIKNNKIVYNGINQFILLDTLDLQIKERAAEDERLYAYK